MRIFVTGATGWVGSAVTRDLIAHGHRVLGLTRSEAGADQLRALGAEPHAGSLEDLPSLAAGAAVCDGVVHTAFNHDFSKFAQNSEDERQAIMAIGAALKGSGRPLIATSGVALLAPGRAATEADSPPPVSPIYPRASEATAMAQVEAGVRAQVVRLPPSVHGAGDHGFVPRLIDFARAAGAAAYVGDGANRWSAVHRDDAAKVYRLALEKGAAGDRWHAVAEEGVPMADIAAVIGRRLGLPVVSRTPEEAPAHFDWFTLFASMDAPASSAHTRAALDWTPTGPGLLADIDTDAYLAG
ncbi:SDR family oxidoreductase [Caulobacter sp. KR2-114]|uniref:SDR family oxidoreductase n=1 Tax=Caulobacter sp. KR2-114 TaxID=3400912 RepID=UPI003BFF2F94